MSLIDEALKHTTDTKACIIAAGAIEGAAEMFRKLFPGSVKALIIEDPNTKRVAGERVERILEAAGIKCEKYVICPGGESFHAVYSKVEEVRGVIGASHGIPLAVGSGTINDLVKRASEEAGKRYMVVGTAASMDGYTSYGAAITKDGMKQTLDCKAPLGCIVDSEVAAAAPAEMTASGYADLIAKIPAGADWMLADAIGSEHIHEEAWRFVQGPLRDALSNPTSAALGNVKEIEKLCSGLVMSAFAMQAMGSSRPASGTEHQISHYWDMEDLCFNGAPVSHGFKVGIGTLVSTKTIEFLLRQDIASIDIGKTVAGWWPDYESAATTFPQIFTNRPAHIKRAMMEFPKKFSSREKLAEELSVIKENWPVLSEKIARQIMPFEEVQENLKKAGAPYKPEMIGISRARLRETLKGVPYMRSRYFALDLVDRLGLTDRLHAELFGPGGIWEI
jgi:glycerol-1-phosphate dehydrogenase [NAD(P)+]